MARKRDWKVKFEENNPTFVEEVKAMSVEDRKQRLVTLNRGLLEVEQALENDESIKVVREQLKEMLAPYKEARKMIKEKIKYLVELLGEEEG